MSNQSAHQSLIALWQRYDWRESIFAPGTAILQALLPDGSAASGAGDSREEALVRCLGETAEWEALTCSDGDQRSLYSASRDGIAAHPDPEIAHGNALLEAFERFAVIRWWFGRLQARPVAADWLGAQTFSHRLVKARKGAAQKRKSGLWQIMTPAGPSVMICQSTSLRGQQTVLGYGCDLSPERAAEKAQREMLLMELNLMELLAAGSAPIANRISHVRSRIESFTRRSPALLPSQNPLTPRRRPAETTVEDARSWFGCSLALHDLPRPASRSGNAFSVWVCRPALTDQHIAGPDDSPFL